MDFYRWMDLIRSEHGPKGSNVRLVLLTLAGWMNRNQTFAWPSQQSIAKCCALNRSTVTRALTSAEKQGWVQISKRRSSGNGQNWKLNEYQIAIPANALNAAEQAKSGASAHHATAPEPKLGADPVEGSELSTKRGAMSAKGSADDNTNSYSNTSNEYLQKYIQAQKAIKNGSHEPHQKNNKESGRKKVRTGAAKPAPSEDQKRRALCAAIEMGAQSPPDVLRFAGETLTLLEAEMLWDEKKPAA